jgi:hypothetical protein
MWHRRAGPVDSYVSQDYKISNYKHQITNKSQIPILHDQTRFGPPEADWFRLRRIICPSTRLRVVSLSNHLIIEICDLEFLFLQYFSTPSGIHE